MKTIFVLFDSLNRNALEPYDISVVETLKNNKVYTHLISDHTHYWEEGGGNYHTKYNTWEIVRGQEGDKWIPSMEKIETDQLLGRRDEARIQDIKNRRELKKRDCYPIEEVFQKAENFICRNKDEDNWFLQIESFDPHEPFLAKENFRTLYPHEYEGEEFDWPDYKKVTESQAEIEHCRYEYAALVSACDFHLGKILDLMDKYNMWKDTELFVTTDHGYLLGEHGWWAKTVQPIYNEVGNTPFFWWHPEHKNTGERDSRLVQTTDVAPTILEAYHIAVPDVMTGKSLFSKKEKKEGCLFGIHGCYLNITDGEYVYMRKPRRTDILFNYTLMPCHMKNAFSSKELEEAELSEALPYSGGCRLLKVPAKPWAGIDFDEYGDMLFDITNDPHQEKPFRNMEIENKLMKVAAAILAENDAPAESYDYWGVVTPFSD